jgi:hypothetical protein
MRCEIAVAYSAVVARLDRATQYPEVPLIEPRGRCVLNPRLRRDDNGKVAATRGLLAIDGIETNPSSNGDVNTPVSTGIDND